MLSQDLIVGDMVPKFLCTVEEVTSWLVVHKSPAIMVYGLNHPQHAQVTEACIPDRIPVDNGVNTKHVLILSCRLW